MKTQSTYALAANLLGGVTYGLFAEDVPLNQCPDQVLKTIKGNAGPGRIDEIKAIRRRSRVLYQAEIDLGQRERMLHVDNDGTLLNVFDEVRLGELPRRVKSAMEPFLTPGSRFDSAGRVTEGGATEYHVDLDLEDDVDLHLVLSESGGILRHREEADF